MAGGGMQRVAGWSDKICHFAGWVSVQKCTGVVWLTVLTWVGVCKVYTFVHMGHETHAGGWLWVLLEGSV